MKDLIIAVADAGLSVTFYYGFQVLTFVFLVFFCAWYGKKLEIGMIKAVIIMAIAYLLGDTWKRILFWAATGFKSYGGENNLRIFVWMPLIGWPLAKLFRVEWKKMCDFMAPAMVATQGVGHFGCIFTGCCGGYAMPWGLYNIGTGTTHFPVQPLEAVTALAIFGYLLHRAKKRAYKVDGLAYPLMLIWFGSTRFVWEFFRDNIKVWLRCSTLSFHALLAFAVGLVAYILIRKKQKMTVIR